MQEKKMTFSHLILVFYDGQNTTYDVKYQDAE